MASISWELNLFDYHFAYCAFGMDIYVVLVSKIYSTLDYAHIPSTVLGNPHNIWLKGVTQISH